MRPTSKFLIYLIPFIIIFFFYKSIVFATDNYDTGSIINQSSEHPPASDITISSNEDSSTEGTTSVHDESSDSIVPSNNSEDTISEENTSEERQIDESLADESLTDESLADESLTDDNLTEESLFYEISPNDFSISEEDLFNNSEVNASKPEEFDTMITEDILKASLLSTPREKSEFNTISALKSANLEAGDIANTLGFYTKGDGGAANYIITKKLISKVDDMISFQLSNGLYATLVVPKILCVDQVGAHGDGVTDDAPYIQKAFDINYKVTLGANKKYKLISNGLMAKKPLDFDGQGSHLIVDDSYSPENGDFEKYILRTKFHEIINYLAVKNVSIDVNITKARYLNDNFLCVFQPRFTKSIYISKTNINIAKSYNNMTAFWMDNGCDSLVITHSNFINNTTSPKGGVIFLNSRTDTAFNIFNEFKKISIVGCTFEGTCGDECLAIWGPNSIDATFNTCNFNWSRANSSGYSRPIAIYNKDNNVPYNVNFITCEFNTNSKYSDYLIGVGAADPSQITVRFTHCTFNADVKNAFLYPQMLSNYISNISDYNYETNKYRIVFNACEINCSKTINGSTQWYNGISAATRAIDCEFNKCDIQCNYCMVYLERNSNTQYYYVPQININNCNITINNAMGLIYKTTRSADASINITSSNVFANGLKTLVNYRYDITANAGITQSGVKNPVTKIKDSTLNGASVTQ